MKLVRFGDVGHEKPGMIGKDGVILDLSAHVEDIAGDVLRPAGLAKLRAIDPTTLPTVKAGTRLGAPVGAISKIVCSGLNYADHAAETGSKVPAEPILFSKSTTSICGPNDPLVIPPGSVKTDWEVELGIVIGQRATRISRASALDYVAGYIAVNDVSERAWQLEGTGEWLKGKSADTFAPLGPWFVTADEVPDPMALNLFLEVNGKRYQDGSTGTMVFDVPYLVSYISSFMTLLPGDIISTGTPPGVGAGQKPPVFLKPGDKIRLGVEGLGEQHQTVVSIA